ncbi:ATP-dependent endonuclease [Streptomyces sp. NPDC047821]|uniref:ATP-dependent nuclease n=1 Tax=Streptomyces sp. NPDC047821 TaxID=3365488 RepID=UPI0037155A02
MRLVSFSLRNFRSITKTERLNLGSLTVLVGPNNEGKSNILLGLVSGMKLLSLYVDRLAFRQRSFSKMLASLANGRDMYNFERDAPARLQSRESCKTTFDFLFELTPSEVADFRKIVKSNLNGRLPVRITASRNSIDFEVRKQGPGAAALSAKSSTISAFIAQRINVRDIPSIRTADDAVALVRGMVESELKVLEGSDEYRRAVDRVADLQAPVLKGLEEGLRESLQVFLPDLKSVEVTVSDRLSALRKNCKVVIDDGTATELRYKGDGVQSLAAMSLIHHLTKTTPESAGMVLAVEEPEAHLHPQAVHNLRDVLLSISQRQQVVITTHSPLFVNRSQVASNVIVNESKARPARSVAEIREVLGVRISDNLNSARLILLVEGAEDQEAMLALMRASSAILRRGVENSEISVEPLRGAGNLGYLASLFKYQLCLVHVFMDNDPAGKEAVNKSISVGGLGPSEVTFANSAGMKESEIEDLYDPQLYADELAARYSVTFPTADFQKRRVKWSDRMKKVFQASGQHWDDSVEADVKRFVAEKVTSDPGSAIHSSGKTVIDNLFAVLERKLQP